MSDDFVVKMFFGSIITVAISAVFGAFIVFAGEYAGPIMFFGLIFGAFAYLAGDYFFSAAGLQ
jgi:hypothetical protein